MSRSSKKIASLFSLGVFLFALFFTLASAPDAEAAKKKKKYADWKGVAADMALEFDAAQKDIEADQYKDAYKHVNDAYFGYYEVQGFERTVMYAISAARVNHIEAQFSDIKHVLLGNTQKSKADLLQQVEDLKIKVYKDAMVLDGQIEVSEPDSAGDRLYTDFELAKRSGCRFVLPLCGETKHEDVEKLDVKPEYVVESVRDIDFESFLNGEA